MTGNMKIMIYGTILWGRIMNCKGGRTSPEQNSYFLMIWKEFFFRSSRRPAVIIMFEEKELELWESSKTWEIKILLLLEEEGDDDIY